MLTIKPVREPRCVRVPCLQKTKESGGTHLELLGAVQAALKSAIVALASTPVKVQDIIHRLAHLLIAPVQIRLFHIEQVQAVLPSVFIELPG
jgi:hypothetical protein